MDEKRLRAHLNRIYCVTAAAVLFVLLFAAALLFLRDADAKDRESFSALLFSVSDQLRTGTAVSHTRLRELESKNGLLLSLTDNGYALLYNSSDDAEKTALFSEAEQLARKDGYDIRMLPLTTERRTSPIYAFSNGGVHCLGAVSILPQQNGYRTVTMVRPSSALGAGKIALLVIGYLISLAALCVLGVRLIDRALLPAVKSRQRQAEFIAAASHELRSPLAVIAANASCLAQRGDLREVSAIEAECARMSHLIGDMLLLASADAKSWKTALSPVETDTLLLNVYEKHLPVFARRGCTLTLSLPEEPLPPVTTDAERLEQVLGILLDNALSYGMTEENRTAELSACAHGRGVAVTVCDHGVGLTDEQKTHAFERFYRGDASRKDKQHFGLGLSVAQELAQLLSAKLNISDTPGGGCTFRILL